MPTETSRVGVVINSLLETVLDRTVVGGYTSVVYRICRNAWNPGNLEWMDEKVVLVAGAPLAGHRWADRGVR